MYRELMAQAVFATIQHFDGVQVIVSFSGGGDQGSIENDSWTVLRTKIPDGSQTDQIMYSELKNSESLGEKFIEKARSVFSVLTLNMEKKGYSTDHLFEDFLYSSLPGFDGEGSVWGTMLFDVQESKMTIVHSFQETRNVLADPYEERFIVDSEDHPPESFFK